LGWKKPQQPETDAPKTLHDNGDNYPENEVAHSASTTSPTFLSGDHTDKCDVLSIVT